MKSYFREGELLGESYDYVEAGRLDRVLEIWRLLEGNPYFNCLIPEWKNNIYIASFIHSAKIDILIANLSIGQSKVYKGGDYKTHFSVAYPLLEEIVGMPPYPLPKSSSEDLPIEVVRAKNSDYSDALKYALQWITFWSVDVLAGMCSVEKEKFDLLKWKVENRIKVLDLFKENDSNA